MLAPKWGLQQTQDSIHPFSYTNYHSGGPRSRGRHTSRPTKRFPALEDEHDVWRVTDSDIGRKLPPVRRDPSGEKTPMVPVKASPNSYETTRANICEDDKRKTGGNTSGGSAGRRIGKKSLKDRPTLLEFGNSCEDDLP